MITLNAILTIAHRDVVKFLRDRARVVSTFVFPFFLIALMGGTLQVGFGDVAGIDLLAFVFTGVYAQTLFQSATTGVVSLIDDRESDLAQEIFVTPISRYAIIVGKILGESLVALAQAAGVLIFGLVVGITLSPLQAVVLIVVGFAVSLFGGAFGTLILSNLRSRRSAEQVFNFILLPQYFLAGVFTPLRDLPLPLDIFSHLSPMRYAVDLTRGLFYPGRPDYQRAVLDSPATNFAVMAGLFALFLVVGTTIFVRSERNR